MVLVQLACVLCTSGIIQNSLQPFFHRSCSDAFEIECLQSSHIIVSSAILSPADSISQCTPPIQTDQPSCFQKAMDVTSNLISTCGIQDVCKMNGPRFFKNLSESHNCSVKTPSMIEVQYSCLPDQFYQRSACLGNRISLSCPRKLAVVIYNASFDQSSSRRCPIGVISDDMTEGSAADFDFTDTSAVPCDWAGLAIEVASKCHRKRVCHVDVTQVLATMAACYSAPHLLTSPLVIVYGCASRRNVRLRLQTDLRHPKSVVKSPSGSLASLNLISYVPYASAIPPTNGNRSPSLPCSLVSQPGNSSLPRIDNRRAAVNFTAVFHMFRDNKERILLYFVVVIFVAILLLCSVCLCKLFSRNAIKERRLRTAVVNSQQRANHREAFATSYRRYQNSNSDLPTTLENLNREAKLQHATPESFRCWHDDFRPLLPRNHDLSSSSRPSPPSAEKQPVTLTTRQSPTLRFDNYENLHRRSVTTSPPVTCAFNANNSGQVTNTVFSRSSPLATFYSGNNTDGTHTRPALRISPIARPVSNRSASRVAPTLPAGIPQLLATTETSVPSFGTKPTAASSINTLSRVGASAMSSPLYLPSVSRPVEVTKQNRLSIYNNVQPVSAQPADVPVSRSPPAFPVHPSDFDQSFVPSTSITKIPSPNTLQRTLSIYDMYDHHDH